jgi:hypothetical protein
MMTRLPFSRRGMGTCDATPSCLTWGAGLTLGLLARCSGAIAAIFGLPGRGGNRSLGWSGMGWGGIANWLDVASDTWSCALRWVPAVLDLALHTPHSVVNWHAFLLTQIWVSS